MLLRSTARIVSVLPSTLQQEMRVTEVSMTKITLHQETLSPRRTADRPSNCSASSSVKVVEFGPLADDVAFVPSGPYMGQSLVLLGLDCLLHRAIPVFAVTAFSNKLCHVGAVCLGEWEVGIEVECTHPSRRRSSSTHALSRSLRSLVFVPILQYMDSFRAVENTSMCRWRDSGIDSPTASMAPG